MSRAKYISPDEAIVMREATRRACERSGMTRDFERDLVADAVLWLSESGYARHGDGTLDPDVLAEAALLQVCSRRAPQMSEAAAFLW